MKRQDVSEFVCSVCCSLRRSQAKTLSVLVPAAMTVARASLAQLGRALAGQSQGATKHCIKRVDRFLGNDRIEPTEAMRGIVQWLAQPREKLLISLDWVDIRHFQCLVLAARLGGRALPLLWAVYRYEDVYRSQNNLEYGLLRVFSTMVPSSVEVTLLADRGFGRKLPGHAAGRHRARRGGLRVHRAGRRRLPRVGSRARRRRGAGQVRLVPHRRR